MMMSSASRGTVTYFSLWMDFIYFSYLIALARTSSVVLNRNSKSGHPCLVPDCGEKAFCFSWLIMTFAVGFLHTTFIVLRQFHSITDLLRAFIMNGCWILLNFFSASVEMIMLILSYILLKWCITVTDLNLPCILGIKPI